MKIDSRKERNNFIYTNHLKERAKERGINLDDVKLTVRNPDYEKRDGMSIKSFSKMEIIAGEIRRELVVVWKWDKDRLILQTTYYTFTKFK